MSKKVTQIQKNMANKYLRVYGEVALSSNSLWTPQILKGSIRCLNKTYLQTKLQSFWFKIVIKRLEAPTKTFSSALEMKKRVVVSRKSLKKVIRFSTKSNSIIDNLSIKAIKKISAIKKARKSQILDNQKVSVGNQKVRKNQKSAIVYLHL